ncbi:CDGSH iron-sulfur domain-containing protein, partial [Pseudomonadota bacterium]
MSKPVVADIKPVKVQLEAGSEYYFCTCGKSNKQPFCDGSHKGSDFKPKAFTAEKDGDAYLCACKHTNNTPFCDGSHKQFSNEHIGKEGPGIDASAKDQQPTATPTAEEPSVAFIHQLAKEGLTQMGHHGPMVAMGVPRNQLPCWDDIQIMVAQLSTKPLAEDHDVGTELVIGPDAKKPLSLKIPLFVSDMSFGALSE